MAFNDFNGNGSPLEDKRLTLSGTTTAGKQQYRIWRDSQQVLVPRGQSITKPDAPENVQANTGVFGSISKGYFSKPIVEFRNTQDYKLFDRFMLQTQRTELPIEEDIDWHEDLGIINVLVGYSVAFECEGIIGFDSGVTWVKWAENGMWHTDTLHFDNHNLQALQGDYRIICNPTTEQKNSGIEYITGDFLKPVTMPLSVIVSRAKILNGNSEMQLNLKNTDFVLNLVGFDFDIRVGE